MLLLLLIPCCAFVLCLEQISKLSAKKKRQRPGPRRRLQLETQMLLSLRFAGGWLGREAKEMRVYFMLSLLFGAMPEYSALREEGKIIFAPKKT